MRSNRLALALSVALTASLCLPAFGGMQWKWRDSSGRLQYSDRPPPAGTPDRDILARPTGSARSVAPPAPAPSASGPTAAAPRPALKASDPELEARRRQAEAQKESERKAAEEKQAQMRAEACEKARGYQRALADGQRISRTNARGEREILDDAQRAQEMARNNETIASACQ